MKKTHLTILTACISTAAWAKQYTASEFRTLFLAAVSYHAVARVCGDSASIETSRQVVRRVINFGEHRGLLSAEAVYYTKNPEEVISRGEAQYRKDRYVGCTQAKEIINQLNDATKRLP
jgi:hypothetical protein